MPKNIVTTPAAVVAVDRLTLQTEDARGDVGAMLALQPGVPAACSCVSSASAAATGGSCC